MNENENVPQSYILIQFTAPGTVVFQSKFENVTPLQMLAISHLLELEGKLALQEQKIQEKQREGAQKIALPGTPHIQMDRKL